MKGAKNKVLGFMATQSFTYREIKALATMSYSLEGYTFREWYAVLSSNSVSKKYVIRSSFSSTELESGANVPYGELIFANEGRYVRYDDREDNFRTLKDLIRYEKDSIATYANQDSKIKM